MIYIIRAPEVMTLQAHLSLCVPGERTFYGVKVPKQPGSGKTYAWKKKKLKETVTGWVNYFKQADMKSYLTRIDECLRRRNSRHRFSFPPPIEVCGKVPAPTE